MRIITVQFDYPGMNSYERLLKVFRASLRKQVPSVDLEEIKIPIPKNDVPGNTQGWSSNTAKLRAWVSRMATLNESAVFCDCDMFCLRDFREVFDLDFDIAYTDRSITKFPLNGGVVFVKSTERTKAFFAEWLTVNELMYRNKRLHSVWRKQYAGMNQTAFGYLLHHGKSEAQIVSVPCSKYNACDEHWGTALKESALVHVKGNLRTHVLQDGDPKGVPIALRSLIQEWKNYEMGCSP